MLMVYDEIIKCLFAFETVCDLSPQGLSVEKGYVNDESLRWEYS